MSEKAIEITQLEYFYRHQWTAKKIRALHPYSLTIQQGECFGFLGHNGAGKTTTIKAILGLIRPYAGNIRIFGNQSTESGSRRSVGYVSEQPYFYDHLTVEEIVEMYAALCGVTSQLRRAAVAQALERLNLSERRKSPMRSLSKGLVQRVAVAQAICHNPRLLILDEPFSGLDPIGRKELRDLFAEIQKQGSTIFMSTHILSDVEALCNRVSIMVKGELKGVYDLKNKDLGATTGFEVTFQSSSTQAAIPEKIVSALGAKQLSHPNALRLYFKERSSAEAAIKFAAENGLILEKFESSHGSLEDLFVQLTKQPGS